MGLEGGELVELGRTALGEELRMNFMFIIFVRCCAVVMVGCELRCCASQTTDESLVQTSAAESEVSRLLEGRSRAQYEASVQVVQVDRKHRGLENCTETGVLGRGTSNSV